MSLADEARRLLSEAQQLKAAEAAQRESEAIARLANYREEQRARHLSTVMRIKAKLESVTKEAAKGGKSSVSFMLYETFDKPTEAVWFGSEAERLLIQLCEDEGFGLEVGPISDHNKNPRIYTYEGIKVVVTW